MDSIRRIAFGVSLGALLVASLWLSIVSRHAS